MSRRVLISAGMLACALLACTFGPQPNLQATVDAALAGTLAALTPPPPDQPTHEAPIPVTPSPPVSTPFSTSGSAPEIGDCPIFPPDHFWNTRIDQLPVHPLSDQYIESIGPDAALHPDFGAQEWEGAPIGIPFNVVDGASVPAAEIEFYYPDESDPGPYPIPADPLIEGGPDGEGDRHILIVDTSDCRLIEIYDAYPAGEGVWEAGSGAIWDLTGYALRPETWTSADAAGLPILPGLVRYEEVAAGEIRHALRFTAEETQMAYVWPARHYASDITDTNVPPMGQRFRLKASFDLSGYPSDVQVILRAMQQYGLVLADNGSDWFITGSPDPGWDDETIIEAFRTVYGSEFEAVDTSSLMIDPDSGQANPP